MPLDLRSLEPFRLHSFTAFSAHCSQQDALLAGKRTAGNGLVMHRPGCIFLQKTLQLGDTEFDTWSKFATTLADFPVFYNALRSAGIPLFFTCNATNCRGLETQLLSLHGLP
jgi:hypothetical protein